MKFCKKHGKQRYSFSFCPYCGLQLEEKEEVCEKTTLPKFCYSEDNVEHLAFKEATAAAWSSIGISGNVSYMLARSGMEPKQLQALLKTNPIKGIGSKQNYDIICKLNDTDFEKFNEVYKTLKKRGSWCWKLAEWYFELPDGCTNGQYEAKKNYFKNK